MIDLHRSGAVVNHLGCGQDGIAILPFDGLVTDLHPDRGTIGSDVINFFPTVESATVLVVFRELVCLVMEAWRDILVHVRVAHEVRHIATAHHFRIGIVDIHSFEILVYNNPDP